MADDRTFVLIGEFRDGITPALNNINDSITRLKQSLGSFGAKRGGFNDLTKSMGKVISAHKILKNEVKELREEMSKSLSVFKEYRREAGKVVAANMHLRGEKFVKKNNPHLQFLDEAKKKARELADIERNIQIGKGRQRGGINGSRAYTPRGGGGGGGGGPRPVRGTPGANLRYSTNPAQVQKPYSKERWGVSRDETFAFGQTLGFTMASSITGAVVQGFQIGVGLMVKPFQMFAGALQERVQDELSDISAAGGLLSVAKRQKESPIVRSFQDSMELTQHTNKYMAEIAAALPGNTQQYIEVGKRMSDTAARMIAMDPAKAIAYAQELAAKEGAGRVVKTQQEAYTQIIGNMATQGVLAGLGEGGAGARGVTGAYGLPQLMERMYNEDEVTMGQFQRYAAIFRDPKIMDALERFIPKINETMKGTVDRARVFDKFFEEVLPPEMIRAFERSSAGIMEAFRTAFIGPETGLLGLGRKFENMGKKMDAYGRYLDKEGEVTDFKNAMDVSLSLFDMLRDIFANISIALYPLVDILPQIFDPLKNIGTLLIDARHLSGQFLQSFENYLAGIEEFAKGTQNKDILKTKRARAGLLAIANYMTDVGAFSEGQFESMRLDILNKPSKELGGVLNKIVSTFFESDMAADMGNLIGSVIGTTLKQVATVIEYFLGVTQTSKLASGLKAGFEDAGGPEAFRSIIRNIFKAIFKFALEIFKVDPEAFTLVGLGALLIPAFVSSFSVKVANWLENFLDNTLEGWSKFLPGAKKAVEGPPITQGAGRFRLTRGDALPVPGVGAKVTSGKGGTEIPKGGAKVTTGKDGMGVVARLKALFQSIDEALVKVGQGLDNAFDGFEKGAGSQLGKLKGLVSKVDDWIEGFALFMVAIAEKIPGMSQLGGLILGDAEDFFGESAFMGRLRGLFSLLRERLWNLGDTLKAGAATLKALPFDLLEGKILIGAEIDDIADSLRKGIGRIFDPLIDVIEGKTTVLPDIGKLRTSLRQGIARMFDPLIDLIEGKYSIREEIAAQVGRVRQGLGGMKGRFQQGLGAAKQAVMSKGGAVKVSVVSWGKTQLTSLKGFAPTIPGNFMKSLKGKGGMLAMGVGIFDAIVALLSGESLGNALGKGAGPVLGSALGAALTPFFPPLGAFIGGWLGSLEAVTGPLGDTFSSIIGTLHTTFGFLAQVGGDLLGVINGIVQKIPGVSEGFNALEFAIFALLSPFKLLEIAISGLYDMYLTIKKNTVGLDKEEQKRLDERNTQRLTDEFTIQGRLRSGYSLKEQKAAEYAKWKEAQAKGDTEAMNRSAEYMRSITNLMQQSGLPAKGTTPKPGAPSTAGGSSIPSKLAGPKVGYLTKDGVKGWQGTDGSWTPLAPKSSTQTRDELRSRAGKDIGNAWKALTTTPAPPPQANKTPNDISEINKKATEQAKGITQVHKGTEKTTTAVKELTAKITAQTSVQTTVAAIYNLLASGSLRVNGVMTGRMPGGGGGGEDFSDVIPGTDPVTGIWKGFTWYDGGLGDAISREMSHAPAGSKLVLANSSETVIPEGGLKVASGYGTGGGGTVINGGINVTVSGSGVSDPDELASLVAAKIGEAVADARSASLFV